VTERLDRLSCIETSEVVMAMSFTVKPGRKGKRKLTASGKK
jgi:hypothetical protein